MAMIVASTAPPGVSLAAPPQKKPEVDVAAFDRGFRSGQDEFNREKYLDAARIWTGAAGLLPETEEHKENRRAIYEYITEAFEKAVEGGINEDVVREGLAILDAYAEAFTAAYPAESLPEHVAKTRLKFRTRLEESEAERQRREKAQEELRPAPKPRPPPPIVPPPPVPKPWRGLAIGGGAAIAGGGAMLGMLFVGLARARSAESQFDDPTNACDVNNPVGHCADIDQKGKAGNRMVVAGIVTAPLLVGAGVALLVVATRRKSGRSAFVPALHPHMAGLVWQTRF